MTAFGRMKCDMRESIQGLPNLGRRDECEELKESASESGHTLLPVRYPSVLPASMSLPPAWQQAWTVAQPRLQALTDSISGQSPLASRVLRVGQLDAELLDQELVQ